MRKTALTHQVPWVNLTVDAEDVQSIESDVLWSMYAHTVIIRGFERSLIRVTSEGLVHGPMHSSIGQEGGAVGSALALHPQDTINGTHRGHHQFLAKSLAYLGSKGHTILHTGELPASISNLLSQSYAEILGLRSGFSLGRGGSMHLQWLEAGALGTNAIVGGGIPFAAGSAWSQQLESGVDRVDNVTVTYFGDGAANIGSALETMNLAGAWKLPLCFFVENNQYAVATHIDEVTAEPRLSARGQAFGIPSWKVDGMDPVAVYLAMREAREHMATGQGPVLVEADVYRFYHQSGAFAGSAFGYRTRDEEKQWKQRDPLVAARNYVAQRGLASEADLRSFEATMNERCDDILSGFFETGEDGKRAIAERFWPSTDLVDEHIRSDLSELSDIAHQEDAVTDETSEEVVFVDAVARSLGNALTRDSSVLLLGEDIHRLNGGTNGATRGVFEQFPNRIIGTPISENCFVGAAGGLAMMGTYRPIVEFMFADFVLVAADQMFNQIGKARHMFGGNVEMPVVVRAKVGIGSGYGSQHSMDPAGLFAMFPGWRIVAPSNPYDYVGLLNTALEINDPVLILEQTELYHAKQNCELGSLDHHLLPGIARIARTGSDVTILTYLNMVGESLAAAEDAQVDAEVVDLRWLDRASIDWDTIEASIKKTNRVLIVEQGSYPAGYGAWLADEIQRRLFDHLDHPVTRVAGGEASPTISRRLERAAIARREEIVVALQRDVELAGDRPLPTKLVPSL
ncbi:MAG: MFS transporter [Rhodococcus sp. (in: high G+C Gram-positive bacteria)]|uniref:dehydrogenase E1 component subunit alpha/beta n=1 Tax=Rhodococcus sp. TaxID=1831 RepID=UPI001220FCD7|nr:alpha-ketoacid dehydrogenase subunit alpha/beta [Rhodococcus sp. (in: high G+C Gram-positive bacteria)]RZL24616.1 MAG: MFS transporter [Rhodococcus sp. (in: high G+C Gram-positive bacteria)]